MHKQSHIYLRQIIWYLEQNFTSGGPNEMFQALKWGIVHFCCKNTFGDTALMKSVNFTILCSIIKISCKNAKLGKWKIPQF